MVDTKEKKDSHSNRHYFYVCYIARQQDRNCSNYILALFCYY